LKIFEGPPIENTVEIELRSISSVFDWGAFKYLYFSIPYENSTTLFCSNGEVLSKTARYFFVFDWLSQNQVNFGVFVRGRNQNQKFDISFCIWNSYEILIWLVEARLVLRSVSFSCIVFHEVATKQQPVVRLGDKQISLTKDTVFVFLFFLRKVIGSNAKNKKKNVISQFWCWFRTRTENPNWLDSVEIKKV